MLSNQGVTVSQYLDCLKEILNFSTQEDVIGFGGFCIVRKKPKLKQDYFAVLEKALPLIHSRGIKQLYLFGIGSFDVLVRTHFLCRRVGIEPSYDTSSYEFCGLFGEVANPSLVVSQDDNLVASYLSNNGEMRTKTEKLERMRLTQTFTKQDRYNLYHPVDLALFNLKLITFFWDEINKIEIPTVVVTGT